MTEAEIGKKINQYEPWLEPSLTEAEYWKKRYVETRGELSEKDQKISELEFKLKRSQIDSQGYYDALIRSSLKTVTTQEALNNQLASYGLLQKEIESLKEDLKLACNIANSSLSQHISLSEREHDNVMGTKDKIEEIQKRHNL